MDNNYYYDLEDGWLKTKDGRGITDIDKLENVDVRDDYRAFQDEIRILNNKLDTANEKLDISKGIIAKAENEIEHLKSLRSPFDEANNLQAETNSLLELLYKSTLENNSQLKSISRNIILLQDSKKSMI